MNQPNNGFPGQSFTPNAPVPQAGTFPQPGQTMQQPQHPQAPQLQYQQQSYPQPQPQYQQPAAPGPVYHNPVAVSAVPQPQATAVNRALTSALMAPAAEGGGRPIKLQPGAFSVLVESFALKQDRMYGDIFEARFVVEASTNPMVPVGARAECAIFLRAYKSLENDPRAIANVQRTVAAAHGLRTETELSQNVPDWAERLQVNPGSFGGLRANVVAKQKVSKEKTPKFEKDGITPMCHVDWYPLAQG